MILLEQRRGSAQARCVTTSAFLQPATTAWQAWHVGFYFPKLRLSGDCGVLQKLLMLFH